MKKPSLHPLTWWIWAGLLAIAIVRFQSTVLTLLCVGAVAGLVFWLREDAPWGKSFSWTLKLSLWILFVRTLIGILIGVPIPGTTLFTLPIIELPSWMPGIRIGGAVTSERLSSARKRRYLNLRNHSYIWSSSIFNEPSPLTSNSASVCLRIWCISGDSNFRPTSTCHFRFSN
jgi:hypothetical protein